MNAAGVACRDAADNLCNTGRAQRPVEQGNTRSMWSGFDPELRRQLQTVRQMVARIHQTPTRTWPLIFMDQYNELLVVREWPDGSITAYATTEYSDIRPSGG